jgi:aspartyl-tRNA(Asn)/glutamyl-tRNA(Gln) amidotransferase subunit A
VEALASKRPRTRFGIPAEYVSDGLDSSIRTAIEHVSKELTKCGNSVEHVSLPSTPYAIAAYYIIADAEASSNLARFDGVKYGLRASNSELMSMYTETRHTGFGDEVKRRIILGTFVLSSGYYDAYYAKAMRVRRVITNDFLRVFQGIDILMTPTTPTTAFKLGEKIDDPLAMYLSDAYTVGANLAGLPALSLPCGKDSLGLPIGLQLIGKPFGEAVILQAASAIEHCLK